MFSLGFEGRWRRTHPFFLFSLLAVTSPKVLGYFLGDMKAVLNGCRDHWTLQNRAGMPLLFQMTVCVDIRVVDPGAWVAFSYSSVHAPRPELGLEGDDGALYGWLLRVRHRFPIQLSLGHWHRVCLRRDVPGNSFSLEVDGKIVAQRTVIAQAIPPSGSLWLGCRPRDRPPGAVLGEVEVYLFRMWADLSDHGFCEDGTVIGWNAHFWGLTSPNARQRDLNLPCAHPPGSGRAPSPGEAPHFCDCTACCNFANFSEGQLISTPNGCTTGNGCPPRPLTTNTSMMHPSTQTQSITTATPPTVYNTTHQTNSPETQQKNASEGRTQPNVTTPFSMFNSTQSTTVQPVFQTNSHNNNNTTPQNTTLSHNATLMPLTENIKLQYTTIAQQNTSSVNNLTLQNTTIPNVTTVYNLTTTNTFTPTPNHMTMYNVTIAINNGKLHNSTNSSGNPSPNHTTEYKVTTATNSHTTRYNVTTAPNSHATEYNLTTAPNSHATEYNVTTAPNSHTTEYNLTTATSNHATEYKVTTAPNSHTTEYNVTTAPNSHATEYNVTTATSNHATEYNVTTATNSHTTEYNVTTATSNHATEYNVTTATNNFTSEDNATTAISNRNLHNSTNNATVSTTNSNDNRTLHFTITSNVTSSTLTPSSNYTTAATIRKTQQNTTVPYENTTVPTTARPVNETLHTTTSTNTLTMNNQTSFVYTTKTTVAPLNNQTTNYTTASVPHNSTTTNRNDTNPTLTTAANTSREHISPPSTLSTTPSTAHGPLPTQDTTTTATVSFPSTTTTTTLQTTTLTGSTGTTAEETPNSTPTQEEQADALLKQIHNASLLNSSQVTQLVGKLENLLDAPTVSQTMGKTVINVVNNLMQADSQALSASANRLIRVMDILGLKLDVTDDTAILSSNSLLLAIRTVDGTNFPSISVNIFNTSNVQFSRSQSRSSQPAMGSVFLPSSLTEDLSPGQQQQASRVQFTYYNKSIFFQDAALKKQTLVSPVLVSSVANMSMSNLKENIQFTIRNTNPVHETSEASCVFWDFNLNVGGGGWSSAGCSVVNATSEDTTCSCNHLTAFAILLDLSRQGITDRRHALVLTFITYIGCGVSTTFLAVTILTYLSFKKLLRDIPAKIHVQLCMSLLLLNLVYLLDGWLAQYLACGLCISTAFFLHYFLLTSFTWSGLEALHMYLSIIQVFTPYLSRYMLRFSLIGWGIPLIVVIVVISVDKDNYGLVTYGKYTDGTSDDFCWLQNNTAFYVGVVAYALLIFVLCLMVFIIVMVQLARIKKQNPQNQSPNRGVMTDLRSIAGLVVLLGLTWGFALFAWGPLYLPFVYLFSIFNSLYGFFIFVFHCAIKENIRRLWRTYLCCGKLRLAENSWPPKEWSRMATQNNRNLSVATLTATDLHLTSRRSSVISDSTNSSGLAFADTGISDRSNSDVALNELHR